jgi:hypothetical protein
LARGSAFQREHHAEAPRTQREIANEDGKSMNIDFTLQETASSPVIVLKNVAKNGQ